MRTLDYIVLIAAGIFAVKYVLPLFGQAYAYAASTDPELDTMKVRPVGKKGKAVMNPSPSTTGGAGENPAWSCITHRERLQVINNNATVTGTVIPAGDGGSHFAPDGDLVFAFKPDPQYKNLINSVNITNKKYGGGLWVEAVCQKANKAKEPRHAGDCKCNAPKFAQPKNGQRLKITGAHCKDVGEEGHMEIHPVYTMEVIG